MRKVICLRSRYGEVHKLVRIGGRNSHLFLFVPANNCCRIIYGNKEMTTIESVDPSGGPFIYVGMKVDNVNKIVKSICMDGSKIIIEFE